MQKKVAIWQRQWLTYNGYLLPSRSLPVAFSKINITFTPSALTMPDRQTFTDVGKMAPDTKPH